MSWIRYRLQTPSVADWRPLIFNPRYPYWCSGYGTLPDGQDCAIIVAYLPPDQRWVDYWPEATITEAEARTTITFTDRFPQPEWFVQA